jgi:hypothetical protein
MPIDPRIASGGQPIQLKDPLEQYNKFASIQAAQNQLAAAQQDQQLNELRLSEARDTFKRGQGLRATLMGDESVETKINNLRAGGYINEAQALEKSQREGDEFRLKNINAKLNLYSRFTGSLDPKNPDTPAILKDATARLYGDSEVGSEMLNAGFTPAKSLAAIDEAAKGGPAAIQDFIYRSSLGLKDFIEMKQPKTVAAGSSIYDPNTGAIISRVPDKPVAEKLSSLAQLQDDRDKAAARGDKKAAQELQRQIDKLNRPESAASPPVTPVTILDPKDPNKTIVVDGRTGRQIGEGVKEGFGVQLSAKEKQKREAAFPTANTAVKSFEDNSDRFIKDIKSLAIDKGLDEITGFVAGRIPALSRDGRRAQALYDKIVAKGGFKGLQDLRAASSTGGALGNISNQEGNQLKAAFAAIDRKQDAADVRAALIDVIDSIEGAKVRMRDTFNSTYEYRAPAKSADQAAADKILEGSK